MRGGTSTSDNASLERRTIRGMAWAYGSFTVARLSVLLVTALLARILSPDDFGVVALALVFIAVLETVYDLGLTQALVILHDDTAEERASTVFVTTVGVAVALAAGLSAVAPFAATFLDEPAVTTILPALSLVLVIRALGNTHDALAQKHLDFRARSAAEVTEVAVRGVVGVTAALAGAGPWSLVLGFLAGSACSTVVLWTLVPWRPRSWPRRADLEGLVGFGGAMTAVSVLSAVIANVDDLLVGRVLGAGALGLYVLAFKLPDIVVLNVSVVAGRVLYPAFAAARGDGVARNVVQSLRYTAVVCAPLAAGLAAAAHPLTLVLFGERWAGAVPATRVLAVYALAITLEIPAGTYYKAIGRADVLVKLAVPRVVLVIGSLLWLADEGIVAVAAAQAVIAVGFCVFDTVLASRRMGVPLGMFWAASWPPLVAAATAGAAAYAVTTLVDPPLVALVAGGALGALVYGAGLWLVARPVLREVATLVRGRGR